MEEKNLNISEETKWDVKRMIDLLKTNIQKSLEQDDWELERILKECESPTKDWSTPYFVLRIHAFNNRSYYLENTVQKSITPSIEHRDDSTKKSVFESIPNSILSNEMETYCKELWFTRVFEGCEKVTRSSPWYILYHLKVRLWECLGFKPPFLDA